MPSMRFHTLGRSGLRVSNISLGTMTFGSGRAWSSVESDASQVFDTFLEAGGNFFDTANLYGDGTSEMLLGKLVEERGVRDRAVIASKYTYSMDKADPNAGGNQRKTLIRSIEASLKRLRTDYLDLYYVHTWDRLTPVDEVMRAMDDVVRAGKVRYVGLSDVPAWYAARAQTLAEWRGFEPVCALQMEYSLIERNIELEFTDVATQLGMDIVSWSPLGMGMLTGKYQRSGTEGASANRLEKIVPGAPPIFWKLTDRNFDVVDALATVSARVGKPMVQVALNWVLNRRGIGSVIVGATTADQLRQSLGALDFTLDAEALSALDQASAPVRHFPYYLFDRTNQASIHGNSAVASKSDFHDGPVAIGRL